MQIAGAMGEFIAPHRDGTFMRSPMAPLHRNSSLVSVIVLGFYFAVPTHAQDAPRASTPRGVVIPPSNSPAVLTGKERLGRKWMDEQRIDNCNVPIDKRGTKPRPSICHHVPTG